MSLASQQFLSMIIWTKEKKNDIIIRITIKKFTMRRNFREWVTAPRLRVIAEREGVANTVRGIFSVISCVCPSIAGMKNIANQEQVARQ